MENHSEMMQVNPIRLVGNHGYRIEGDTAFLNAELAVPREEALQRQWALQLWACERPHAGGPLSGIKVAEVPVEVPGKSEGGPQRLEAEGFARLPASGRDYSMVLVLASGSPGAFEQVHDFANYPERHPFLVPHLDGEVGYVLQADEVVLRVDRVSNPRRRDNLSGSLALELWALGEAYAGGSAFGELLASVALGRVAGESAFEQVEERVPFSAPAAGKWHLVMMLREWTAAGYVTRDFCNFAAPYEVAPTSPAVAAAPPAIAPSLAEIDTPPPIAPTVLGTPPATAPTVIENAASRRVSIETGSVEALSKVKGLTKKLATEIIKARPFTSLDDLVRVRGIGEKMLRKLREHLTL